MDNSIEEFVNQSIKRINKGLPKNYSIIDELEFEITLTTTENASGGIDIKLFSGKLEDKSVVTQRIKFLVSNNKDNEKAKNQKVKDILKFGSELYAGYKNFMEMINEGKIESQEQKSLK